MCSSPRRKVNEEAEIRSSKVMPDHSSEAKTERGKNPIPTDTGLVRFLHEKRPIRSDDVIFRINKSHHPS